MSGKLVEQPQSSVGRIANDISAIVNRFFPQYGSWLEKRKDCLGSVVEKTGEILSERGVPSEEFREIPVKTAMPLLENASLEEDPSLQDLWATLLANALDPHFPHDIRSAYISIIKDLSPLDVRLIRLLQRLTAESRHGFFPLYSHVFDHFKEEVGVEWKAAEASIENLIRLRLISTDKEVHAPQSDNFGNTRIEPLRANQGDKITFRTHKVLARGSAHFTPLGLAFLNACCTAPSKDAGVQSSMDRGIEKKSQPGDESQ